MQYRAYYLLIWLPIESLCPITTTKLPINRPALFQEYGLLLRAQPYLNDRYVVNFGLNKNFLSYMKIGSIYWQTNSSIGPIVGSLKR